ncbi:MAG: hypothetical protein P8N94_02625 [Gammaproteobacteria bacterium]|nr:hypothetical protein [Gammaproteobacteria bacterium]
MPGKITGLRLICDTPVSADCTVQVERLVEWDSVTGRQILGEIKLTSEIQANDVVVFDFSDIDPIKSTQGVCDRMYLRRMNSITSGEFKAIWQAYRFEEGQSLFTSSDKTKPKLRGSNGTIRNAAADWTPA